MGLLWLGKTMESLAPPQDLDRQGAQVGSLPVSFISRSQSTTLLLRIPYPPSFLLPSSSCKSWQSVIVPKHVDSALSSLSPLVLPFWLIVANFSLCVSLRMSVSILFRVSCPSLPTPCWWGLQPATSSTGCKTRVVNHLLPARAEPFQEKCLVQ